MAVYPGLDVSRWDASGFVFLWRRSNLRFCGFYLAHAAAQRSTTFTTHLHDFQDLGWKVLPLWVPTDAVGFNRYQLTGADGTAHALAAIARAEEAQLERGATIYLDIEGNLANAWRDRTGRLTATADYVIAWLAGVRQAGYLVGIYCHDAEISGGVLLGNEVSRFAPAFYAVSIRTTTRAAWDQATFRLDPPLIADWPAAGRRERAYDHDRWTTNPLTVACQYDWFRQGRSPASFNWPDAHGQPDPRHLRDVDWNVSNTPDIAHPFATATVAVAQHRTAPDTAVVYVARPDRIDEHSRDAAGRLGPANPINLRAADLRPRLRPADDGFDPGAAAATTRIPGSPTVFALGADGLIRAAWRSATEQYPHHDWPLNPGQPARKGTPIVAVARTDTSIDCFYVSSGHELVRQWATRNDGTEWAGNRQVIAGTLVAGGTNLVGLPSSNDGQWIANQLDVFFIAFDHNPPSRSRPWDDQWQVVQATWPAGADWRTAGHIQPVPGLGGTAAASGVAAIRDAVGDLHLIAQRRSRAGLLHATRRDSTRSATWSVGAGPTGALPRLRGRDGWWMTLHLVAFANTVLLVGVTCTGHLAWATFSGASWSPVSTTLSAFSTSRPLSLGRRGPALLDIFGVDEHATLERRTLRISTAGAATIATP